MIDRNNPLQDKLALLVQTALSGDHHAHARLLESEEMEQLWLQAPNEPESLEAVIYSLTVEEPIRAMLNQTIDNTEDAPHTVTQQDIDLAETIINRCEELLGVSLLPRPR